MNPPKSPGVSAVLAFLWPGAGYIYCGLFGLMIAAWAGYAVLIVAMSVSAGFLAGQLRHHEANGLMLVLGGALLLVRMCEIIHAYKIAEADNRKGALRRGRGRRRSRRSRELSSETRPRRRRRRCR